CGRQFSRRFSVAFTKCQVGKLRFGTIPSVTMNQPSIPETRSHVTSEIHGFLALCRTVENKLHLTVMILEEAWQPVDDGFFRSRPPAEGMAIREIVASMQSLDLVASEVLEQHRASGLATQPGQHSQDLSRTHSSFMDPFVAAS